MKNLQITDISVKERVIGPIRDR